MIRRPPRSTLSSSSAASDVYKRQLSAGGSARRQRPSRQRAGVTPHASRWSQQGCSTSPSLSTVLLAGALLRHGGPLGLDADYLLSLGRRRQLMPEPGSHERQVIKTRR